MKSIFQLLKIVPIVICCQLSFAQPGSYDVLEGAEVRIYKTADGFDLKINIVKPSGYQKRKKYPAIVFFFGGGWKRGDVHQFEQHCQWLASKGMIAMAVNYRVASRNNSTPFDAVEDAKSAIRWVREHARELGVNKNKIVAAGGSAGGHLAACTALIEAYDARGENAKVSSVPNALVLFNPVINTMPEGYGYERLKEKAKSISPAHHVVPKLPPTIIFHGTEDTTVPFENITDFRTKMETAGNTCYLVPFEGQKHGFFNYGRNGNKYYDLTIEKTESFLRGLNFIK
ncbi:MAG: alpha/beta hydrolase [Cytophagales bacterium]|nr:alpha/beta hydrolase [Cytophagales bacterium]